MKKLIVLLVLLFSITAVAEDGITLISCIERDAKYGNLVNAQIDTFEALIEQWPGTAVDYKTRTAGEIGMLGRLNRLPDVFMLDPASGRIYARQGLLQEVTEGIVHSPYAEQYRNDALAPFIYYGRMAAFPALSSSQYVVIYDREVFPTFPDTLKALAREGARLRDAGYEAPIALGSVGGPNFVSAVLSPLLATEQGGEWFDNMVENAGSFRDQVFMSAMEEGLQIYESGVFQDKFIDAKAEDAIHLFTEGKAAAVLTGDTLTYKVLEETRRTNFALYDRLGFAALPIGPAPSGFSYGLFLNSSLADDPERLAECIELCQYLTGPAYAATIGDISGNNGFTTVENDYKPADETLRRLSEHISTTPTCRNIRQYLYHAVWTAFDEAIREIDAGTLPPSAEIIANRMQDQYEKYYLSNP